MTRQLTHFILILTITLLTSCGLSYTYNEYVDISEAKWFKNEVARFEVSINDTISYQDFYLSVRNDTEYRFSNLFVFLTTHFPNGNVTRDTIECVLADISGKWNGKGWGNIKDNKILLKSDLIFPAKGKYEFFVQQAMREDTLRGIHSVGISIEKID